MQWYTMMHKIVLNGSKKIVHAHINSNKFKYKMVIKQVKNQQINTYKYNKQLIYILKHT